MDRFRASLPTTQQRLDKLRPRLEEARTKLRTIRPDVIATNSGCQIDHDGNFRMDFMGREYVITLDDLNVQQAGAREDASSLVQSVILTYLATADGTPPGNQWISFRDLPNGLFYEQAFHSYSGAELMRGLHGDIEAFKRAAQALQGEAITVGEAGYAFRVLPRLRLAIALWGGDEDFPVQARVLFEDTAPHYMVTDGLAILGGQLVGHLLKAASREARHA